MIADSFKELTGDRRLRWTVTGAAGFIGSHLAETLVELGQSVIGLDDLSTGSMRNVTAVESAAAISKHGEFRFMEGSIESSEVCAEAVRDTNIVLHQAALGSIPRSIADPVNTHSVNAGGTLNMLVAARNAGVGRFVYASSSSVYGDDTALPKQEDLTGWPLAPYASTKRACEFYARNCSDHYGLETIGLRYFNVFGPRQDPNGAYAAVVPKWISQIASAESITINGDGETSRDFCYVANVIQANLRAALAESYDAAVSVFNVANGERTTLNQLYRYIALLHSEFSDEGVKEPTYAPHRMGDVRHSQADISRAVKELGYSPTHDVLTGLRETVAWFRSQG